MTNITYDLYDLKVYENGHERETIRALTYAQAFPLGQILTRFGVKFTLKGYNKPKSSRIVWVDDQSRQGDVFPDIGDK